MKEELTVKVGNRFSTKFGELEVIEYLSWDKVKIRWLDKYKHEMFTQKYAILKGAVKNPFHPVFYGIGFFGVGEYGSQGEYRKAYYTWKHMLKRCYDETSRHEWSSYSDVSVCDEWHNYQNFAKWYFSVDYNQPGWHLDKDIISRGNKLYSPDLCAFVPGEINVLFTKADKIRGEYKIGVHKTKARPNLFVSACNNGSGKVQYLGCHSTEEQAFLAYKRYKEGLIVAKAEKFKDYLDPRVYTSMVNYEVKEDD